jgi:PAS domain S-box-containing protein
VELGEQPVAHSPEGEGKRVASRLSGAQAYAASVVFIAVAAAVRFMMHPLLHERAPFLTFTIAVVAAAWVGGVGPALLGIALSVLISLSLFIPPEGSLALTTLGDQVAVGFFLGVSLFVVWIIARVHAGEVLVAEAAQRARVEHERLKTTMLSIGDAVLVTDSEGRISLLNAVAEGLTGWIEAEAKGKSVDEVFRLRHEETGEPMRNPVWQVIDTGQVVALANHALLISKGGKEVAVDDSAAPIKDERGILIGVVLVFRDVGERRSAQERLKLSEARFRTMIEQAPMSIQLFDLDGNTVAVNKAWEELWGVTLEQIGGYNVLQDPQLEEKGVAPLLRKAFAGEITPLPEILYDPTDHHEAAQKRYVSALAYPVKDGIGETQEVVLVHQDVTAQREAEQAREELLVQVERQRQRLDDILATVPGVVWEAWGQPDAASQRIDFVSDYVETMLGYTVEEWLATPNFWLSIVHPEDKERAAAKGYEIFMSGEPGTDEFRWITKDGRVMWVQAQSVVIKDEEGKPVGMRGVNLDITDRVLAEQEVRVLNTGLEERVGERTAQLEAAVQELEAFCYTVSHDLRAPLRAISGYAGILEEEYAGKLEGDGLEMLENIGRRAGHLGRLIDDLLNFSRLSRKDLATERIEMKDLVEETVSSIRDSAGVEIVVQELPAATGDPGLIAQVWENLISNALKFTQQSENPRVTISGQRRGAEVEYVIEDNGIGFDMRYASKMFGVFERLEPERAFEGSGVGLAIVQRIISRHGGRVWAEGEQGRGARFFFTLPAAESSE